MTIGWPRSLRVDGSDSEGGWWGTAFPIGGMFLSIVDTDPSVLFGFGTWALFAKGRLLMAPPAPSGDVFIWTRLS
jgi:hypothetical protein